MIYKLNNIEVPYEVYRLVRNMCWNYNIEYYRQVTPAYTNLYVKGVIEND